MADARQDREPTGDTYFDTRGVATVKWDQANKTDHVEWEGWANSAEFAALLDAGVPALKDHSGSRWLAHCRRQKVLSPADQDRADREWLPKASAAGLRRFAVVLPESGLAATNIKQKQRSISAQFAVGYFVTVEEAREWLVQ